MKFYPNGNANGSSTLSVQRCTQVVGGELYGIYFNGNCGGMPDQSFVRKSSGSDFYPNGNAGAHPTACMRISGDRLTFYPNGNANGSPDKCLVLHGASAGFYPNGNGGGHPTMSLRQNGRLIEIFLNGNCNGFPEYSIEGADSIRDAAEFFGFVLWDRCLASAAMAAMSKDTESKSGSRSEGQRAEAEKHEQTPGQPDGTCGQSGDDASSSEDVPPPKGSAQAKRKLYSLGAKLVFFVALGLWGWGMGMPEEVQIPVRYLIWGGAAVTAVFAIWLFIKSFFVRCPKCHEGKMRSSSELIAQGPVYYKKQVGGDKQVPYRKETYRVTMTCKKCGYKEVFTEQKEANLLFSQRVK